MILNIRKDGDPVLRRKSKEVREIDERVKKLIENMFETMYSANGVGLAAPQVGISERIIVVDAGSFPIALINPEVIEESGEDTSLEGCLSIPGFQGEVVRAAKVRVKGMTVDGKECEFTAEGLLARAIQHEIDHLKGILFTDRAERIFRV
jgi:peptide deformylase